MSRLQTEYSGYLISLGWDRPFDTFFAQVEALDDDAAEEPLLWLGQAPGSYRSLAVFLPAFEAALDELGLSDFVLTVQQREALRLAREQSPPGSGLAERSPALLGAMTLFDDDASPF